MNIERKNDSKLVAWENKQIEEIKKGKFDSKYTFVIIYGSVNREMLLHSSKQSEQHPSIYVTNSTTNKQFDSKKFDIMAFQNQDRLFKHKL